jgi:hypothetical protein
MADPSRDRNIGENRVESDPGSTTGTPRWVKVFGVVALIVVVLFVVVTLVDGEHGPGRHAPGGSNTPGVHTGPPPGFEHGDQKR